MDKELLLKYLRELEANLNKLKGIEVKDVDELKSNTEKLWAVLHGLQIIIQNILDIGNNLLSYLKVNDIETYRDIIEKMGEKKIIPEDFADGLKNLAGFRNILVHEYIDVDVERVYSVLRNKLADIDKFLKYTNEYIEKQGV